MAKFPTREAEVASLAGTMIYGLTEFAGDFPSCPVAVETLQEALDRFTRAKETAATERPRVFRRLTCVSTAVIPEPPRPNTHIGMTLAGLQRSQDIPRSGRQFAF